MNHKAEKWLDKERRNIILMWWTAAVAQVSFITSTMLMMQDICATGAENENKARPAVGVCDSEPADALFCNVTWNWCTECSCIFGFPPLCAETGQQEKKKKVA